MLYSLGPIELKIVDTVNPTRGRASSAHPFASHDVLGTAPIYEDMGEGESRRTISCVTFPNDDLFSQGLSSIAALNLARSSGVPQLLLRGDGTLLGFFLITGVQETEETLDWTGVPGEVQIEIELTLAEAPFADALFNLFGGVL